MILSRLSCVFFPDRLPLCMKMGVMFALNSCSSSCERPPLSSTSRARKSSVVQKQERKEKRNGDSISGLYCFSTSVHVLSQISINESAFVLHQYKCTHTVQCNLVQVMLEVCEWDSTVVLTSWQVSKPVPLQHSLRLLLVFNRLKQRKGKGDKRKQRWRKAAQLDHWKQACALRRTAHN